MKNLGLLLVFGCLFGCEKKDKITSNPLSEKIIRDVYDCSDELSLMLVTSGKDPKKFTLEGIGGTVSFGKSSEIIKKLESIGFKHNKEIEAEMQKMFPGMSIGPSLFHPDHLSFQVDLIADPVGQIAFSQDINIGFLHKMCAALKVEGEVIIFDAKSGVIYPIPKID